MKCSKTFRLIVVLNLTFTFFLVEIVVGYITNSLALVSDSYHMISDVIALTIGLASLRISKLSSKKNTYGWARSEILGALINAVFLLALCFTIFIEALQRFAQIEKIENPDLLLIVGGIGLGINVVGLVMLGNEGHGHSHDKSVENSADEVPNNSATVVVQDGATDAIYQLPNPPTRTPDEIDSAVVPSTNQNATSDQKKSGSGHSSSQMNMRGVFLHVLGDALGSVVVIVSALVIKYVEEDWRYMMDPALSLGLVIIILTTTIPLLKESSLILLQTVPTYIQVNDLEDKLKEKVNGVLGIHEFHVWQLAGSRVIATVHIQCKNAAGYMEMAENVKNFFHEHGIHSTTVQAEFVELSDGLQSLDRDCLLECGPGKQCFPDTCCFRQLNPAKDGDQSVRSIGSGELRQRSNLGEGVYRKTSNGDVQLSMEFGGDENCSSSPSAQGTHL